jgi:predicted nuclease of predicted toxin-antitoxin system
MRVLLDENLPVRLAGFLIGHAVATVKDMRWLGVKNGRLIALAETGFDVLVTLDKGMKHQNDLRSTRLAFVVLRSPSNRLGDLLTLVPLVLRGLDDVAPGRVIVIPPLP